MPPTQTQNRKDLLQAYRLMTQRSALALIVGEPDSANQPLRRRSTATVSGILVGVIACVLFGVLAAVGIIATPEKNLVQSGTVVIDKDTGTSYIPCGKELCPALNYTSALLALKNGKPPVTSVSQAQLSGTPIGPTVGIMGLPQDPPTESNLIKGPWAVCDNGKGTSTLVGGKSVGGTDLRGSAASLVQSGGQDYVLLNGQKMMLPAPYVSQVSQGTPARPVTAAFLNSVPAGADFIPPVPFGGSPANSAVPGGKAGQVYNEANASGQNLHLVLEQDGRLHKVDGVQATLLAVQAHEAINALPSVPAAAANTPLGAPVNSDGLPTTMPNVSSVPGTLCVTSSSGGKQTITKDGTIPANATPTGNNSPTTVNQVWMPSGHGALIGLAPASGSASPSAVSSWVLLSGATRYGLNGEGVASDLGYKLPADGVVLPASLVSVLPQGKGLDPTVAAQPASG